MPKEFFEILSETTSSPFGFAAFIFLIVGWTFASLRLNRLKILERKLDSLKESQRLELLKLEYDVRPRNGISAEQWLRARRQSMWLLGFIISVSSLTLVVLSYQWVKVKPGETGDKSSNSQSAVAKDWMRDELDRIQQVTESQRVDR